MNQRALTTAESVIDLQFYSLSEFADARPLGSFGQSEHVAETIFWISLLAVLYVYAGYWLLLRIWSALAAKPVRRADWEPSVTIIVAAHNERNRIEAKILNLLKLNYPPAKRQIIISLDGPTDGTETVVSQYTGRGIHMIWRPAHRGKASALNAAMAEATGQIILFADARQALDPMAIRELVADLHDPAVGAVSGELLILDDSGKEAADSVGLYWRYEKLLRVLESDVHSVAGATGALYAVRRRFVKPVPEDIILDDVYLPMQAVLEGNRLVYQPRARVYEAGSYPPSVEFRRKTRTLMGNYQLMSYMPQLLMPWRNPIFFQFLSHKVGRLMVPYFLCALFISNAFLLHSPLFAGVFALQLAFYLSACAGRFISRHSTPARQAEPALNGRENAV